MVWDARLRETDQGRKEEERPRRKGMGVHRHPEKANTTPRKRFLDDRNRTSMVGQRIRASFRHKAREGKSN